LFKHIAVHVLVHCSSKTEEFSIKATWQV